MYNRITKGDRSGWRKYPGCAKQIDVGNSGQVWKIGCDELIYKLIGTKFVRANMIKSKAISVDDEGKVYLVSNKGEVVFLDKDG